MKRDQIFAIWFCFDLFQIVLKVKVASDKLFSELFSQIKVIFHLSLTSWSRYWPTLRFSFLALNLAIFMKISAIEFFFVLHFSNSIFIKLLNSQTLVERFFCAQFLIVLSLNLWIIFEVFWRICVPFSPRSSLFLWLIASLRAFSWTFSTFNRAYALCFNLFNVVWVGILNHNFVILNRNQSWFWVNKRILSHLLLNLNSLLLLFELSICSASMRINFLSTLKRSVFKFIIFIIWLTFFAPFSRVCARSKGTLHVIFLIQFLLDLLDLFLLIPCKISQSCWHRFKKAKVIIDVRLNFKGSLILDVLFGNLGWKF